MASKKEDEKIDVTKTYVPLTVTLLMIMSVATTIIGFFGNKYMSESKSLEDSYNRKLEINDIKNAHSNLVTDVLYVKSDVSKNTIDIDDLKKNQIYFKEEIFYLKNKPK